MNLTTYLLPIAVLAIVLLVASSSQASTGGGGNGKDDIPDTDLPEGDVDPENWGATPAAMRPLFMLMEKVVGVPGSGRFFAVIAYIESRFKPTAHNQDLEVEVPASQKAYANNYKNRPPLKYAKEAADFGSGGLFARLGPYFLWTATDELKDKAPLLDLPPEAMFEPRLAAYSAVVMLRRILTHYQVDDLLDARVGWGGVNYLGDGRGSKTYYDIRDRFVAGAAKVGIDLKKLPAKFEVGPWVGYEGAYKAIMEGVA